ncbi:NUDIX hydrolase [Terasakiella sp.]|uniref:NUDIX hydrolase n=1 Tax=Terasakiella sp. TaxID=2034861 RepID=UPI003AA83FAE
MSGFSASSIENEGSVQIGLTAVIVAVTDAEPRILVVRRVDHALASTEEGAARQGEALSENTLEALPYGPFYPGRHRTLDMGLRSWVEEQAELDLGYVEQLYTFGDRGRDPRERELGGRILSIGYLALAQEAKPAGAGEALWQNWYRYFPWEDWRDGKPGIITQELEPGLEEWAAKAESPSEIRERFARIDACFGSEEVRWNEDRVLERYELLYEAGLVTEAARDQDLKTGPNDPSHAMVLDHRRILATAMGRLRGKLKYRPVVFELVPPTFTLFELQKAVEAITGNLLHKQNFRRMVEKSGLVEGTGKFESRTGGRPAETFRYVRDILAERLTAGPRLPVGRR